MREKVWIYIQQNQTSKSKRNKDFLRQTNIEGSYYQHTCSCKKFKISFSRRKMVQFRNLYLHKRRKKIRYGINKSKNESFSFLILNWSKIFQNNSFFQSNNIKKVLSGFSIGICGINDGNIIRGKREELGIILFYKYLNYP